MWQLKLAYFVVTIRESCFGRFFSIFLLQQGLSAYQIGVISGVCCLVQFVSSPFWTFVADYFKNRYFILQIVIILSGCLSFLLLLPHYILHINDPNILFPLFACFVVIYNFPDRVHAPLMDTLCILKLGNQSDQYGKQRCFASISWGIVHILLGIGLDFGLKIQSIVIFFMIASIPAIIACFIAFHDVNTMNDTQKNNQLIEIELIHINTDETNTETFNNDNIEDDETHTNDENDENMTMDAVSIGETLRFIIKCKANIAIFLVGFAWGGMLSCIGELLFVYIEDLNGKGGKNNDITYTYLGLSVAATLPFEITMLYISSWFIYHIGYRNMIYIAFISYIIRVIAYTFITKDTLWLLFVVEPLHGFIYAFVKISTVELVNDIFPEKYAASAQGLSYAFKWGIGPFIFDILGGFVLDYIGGKWLYRILAIAALVVIIIFHWLSHGNQLFQAKKYNHYQLTNINST